MMNIPTVKLQVEGMRHEITAAIARYNNAINDELTKAIEEQCSPENIEFVVRRAVEDVFDNVIREEIERFFKYGAGREKIAEAVVAALEDNDE